MVNERHDLARSMDADAMGDDRDYEAPTAAPGAKDGASEVQRCLHGKSQDEHCEQCVIDSEADDPPAPDAGNVAPGERYVVLTESQRMALCTVISEQMRRPDGPEVHIDCSQSPPVETTLGDLLAIFMRVAPPVSLPPVNVGTLPHLAQALSEVPSRPFYRPEKVDKSGPDSPAARGNIGDQLRELGAEVKRLQSPRAAPDGPPEFTPAVHSTLLEMVGFAAKGRCMACGWPVKASPVEGCVQGNCSFRPGEHSEEYQRWWQRTQLLTLARKYAAGEFGKALPSGADLDAVAEEKAADRTRGER
jgi:hypothetical protein